MNESENKPQSDALFIGAHPDDLELLAGGLIARLSAEGKTVVMADATKGQMGTRGTVEERMEEAHRAAEVLGARRINLDLEDGKVEFNMEASIRSVVKAIREHRPRLVFTHSHGDHHPDHNGLSIAVKRAVFLGNVLKYDTGQERFAPSKLCYFWSNRERLPERIDFVADVTDYWEKKVEAIKCYETQIEGGRAGGPETFLTRKGFWHRIESRFGYFGSLVNVKFAEPYLVDGLLRLDDPTKMGDV